LPRDVELKDLLEEMVGWGRNHLAQKVNNSRLVVNILRSLQQPSGRISRSQVDEPPTGLVAQRVEVSRHKGKVDVVETAWGGGLAGMKVDVL